MKELIDRGIVPDEISSEKLLSGGTMSKLVLLEFHDGSKKVVKYNSPAVTRSEAMFLEKYQSIKLLPRLYYVDPSYEFLMYSFIEGAVSFREINKAEALKDLVNRHINHYQKNESFEGWGWADEPSSSWNEFLINAIEQVSIIIGDKLTREDAEWTRKLALEHKIGETPFLLHGDCGFHNFIFRDGKLSGVIDPIPVYGEPVYDLIYAFCSTPHNLTKDIIDSAASLLIHGKSADELYKEVAVGLYLRIAACIKHHPDDLERYLDAWGYWKKLIEQKKASSS